MRRASVNVPTAFDARRRVGDDACAVGQLSFEVVAIDRRVVGDVDETDLQPEVVRELEPGGDVAVVVELRDEDLVALTQSAAEGACQREVERRHVGAEDGLVGIAAQECRRGQACLRDQRIAATARVERPVEVRVRLAQVTGDRVDDGVGYLRPAGTVEEHGRGA